MKAKKILATVLSGTMLISAMATVAFAEETLADGIYVGTTKYDTIAAAATAAGINGTVTISGTVAVDVRQGLNFDNITLEGVNNGTITTSEAFAQSSDSNRKTVLSVEGENVTIKNLSFDGGDYGDNLVPDSSVGTQFNVLRINSGDVTLENVYITGSNRTLLSIGTADYEATVIANGLYCDAPLKTVISEGLTQPMAYADVNVVNGTLYLNSGEVNGLISTDYSLRDGYSGTLTLSETAKQNHFTLNHYYIRVVKNDLTSTVEHFVNSYHNGKESAASIADDYVYDISKNLTVVGQMVAYAKDNCDADTKAKFVTLLTDAKAKSSSSATTLDSYISQLQ